MYDWAPIKAISQIFWYLLNWIHLVVNSYGWSIILLTIVFRALLLPLDLKQKISMKRMQVLQPKITALNEKYKNDKEKAAQMTMALYKTEKVSPFSGCLPSLIQMFLFFAFYGALRIVADGQLHDMFIKMQELATQYGGAANIPQNVLPHVEGWLWIHNVWQPDTAMFTLTPQAGAWTFMGMDSHIIPPYSMVKQFSDFKTIQESVYNDTMLPLMQKYSTNWNGWFVMPILAGISSFFQTKITMPPQPVNADPKAQSNPFNNKTMMYLFPLMSVYFSAVSNSIFALYWFTSNLCVTVTYKLFDIHWTAKMKKEEAEEKARLEQQQKEEAERIAAATALKAARADAKNRAKEGKK